MRSKADETFVNSRYSSVVLLKTFLKNEHFCMLVLLYIFLTSFGESKTFTIKILFHFRNC